MACNRPEVEVCADIRTLCRRMREAGDAVSSLFHAGDTTVRHKDDGSPQTGADLVSERIMLAALTVLDPSGVVISEESSCDDPPAKRFWLLDPVDGTREFLNRSGQFTINLALIEDNRPVLGIIHQPLRQLSFFARRGAGAGILTAGDRYEPLSAPTTPATTTLQVIHSARSGTHGWLEELIPPHLSLETLPPLGSALKLCHLARGEADIYLRTGRTMEWDTAAGHLIIQECGGDILTLDGRPLAYGKDGYRNGSFLALGARALDPLASRLRRP